MSNPNKPTPAKIGHKPKKKVFCFFCGGTGRMPNIIGFCPCPVCSPI